MKKFETIAMVAIALSSVAVSAHADTIADWTFETTAPTTAGPFAADIGTGTAMGSHAGASVYSSPVGNGSSHSFSSNTWAVGDYYQFGVSTVGLSNISLSWDQTSSSTGPKDFELEASTNGSTFTNVAAYSVQVNGSPNTAWTSATSNSLYTFNEPLASMPGLNDQSSVLFRLVNTDTAGENGSPVASTGTDRVDNFMVSGTAVAPVPLPAAVWLLGGGLLGIGGFARRRRA